MARKTTRTATTIAEEQAAADQALLDAITARDADRPRTRVADIPQPQPPTLQEVFGQIVDMIADKKRTSRLSETTLTRIWELTLMWDLNNRQNQPPAMPDWGGGEDTGTELPEIHERITADSSSTTTEE